MRLLTIGIIALILGSSACRKSEQPQPVAQLEQVSSKLTVEAPRLEFELPETESQVREPVLAKAVEPNTGDQRAFPKRPDGAIPDRKPYPQSGGSVDAEGGKAATTPTVRGAAKRTVVEHDLKMIHTFIEYASGASGRMPQLETIRTVLKQEAPEIEQKIYQGLIVLNPAKNREEIWAYEAEALVTSGWVATNSGVETMDAATLKRRLGR